MSLASDDMNTHLSCWASKSKTYNADKYSQGNYICQWLHFVQPVLLILTNKAQLLKFTSNQCSIRGAAPFQVDGICLTIGWKNNRKKPPKDYICTVLCYHQSSKKLKNKKEEKKRKEKKIKETRRVTCVLSLVATDTSPSPLHPYCSHLLEFCPTNNFDCVTPLGIWKQNLIFMDLFLYLLNTNVLR